MADNYLEKKMEEYRAGKLGRQRHATTPHSAPRQPGEFDNMIVYVTGGASGIGRAIVDRFRKAGAWVAFCDIDSKAGAATSQATGSQFHPLDVSDSNALERSLRAVADRHGRIDIIVNNAGIGNFKPLAETTVTDFDSILAVNLKPVFVTAKVMADIFTSNPEAAARGGRIVNICSTRHIMSEQDTAGYSASKGAIASLTHSLMMSLSPLGITVNSISPGWIHTGTPDSLSSADHAMHPSRRVGTPADIARAVLFLASPAADFINGIDLVVDGGMTHKMIY